MPRQIQRHFWRILFKWPQEGCSHLRRNANVNASHIETDASVINTAISLKVIDKGLFQRNRKAELGREREKENIKQNLWKHSNEDPYYYYYYGQVL